MESGSFRDVVADQAPLGRVLQEVGNLTGIEIQGLNGVQDLQVSIRLAGLTIGEALRQLLANVNHAIVEYATPKDGTPSLTVIVGQGLEPFMSQEGVYLSDRADTTGRAQAPLAGIQRDDERAAAMSQPIKGVEREDERAMRAAGHRAPQRSAA